MNDLIDRQSAIAALERKKDKTAKGEIGSFYNTIIQHDIDAIVDLPPAQPEIIRCKDCKWYELPSHKIYENCVRWMKSNCILLPIKPDDYCGYAERRTND